ncbi:hypothetical protein [Aliterella atlantica]|uniref:Uncharacterized protein n=1 Tax=Aliterella atlantica CENA595 TaxID=1618023 RepID=A0A0D8ZN59_9CYAN|nr:hypothetical protein [Aliterella atlantica]KJH70238.1 hypothetical protein UH38_18985 [Aliterella atlantica CENA595]
MILNNNLIFTLDEILLLVENLPTEEKTELIQRLLSKPSALDVNYLQGSMVGLVSTMGRDEISDLLRAIANRIAADGDVLRK